MSATHSAIAVSLARLRTIATGGVPPGGPIKHRETRQALEIDTALPATPAHQTDTGQLVAAHEGHTGWVRSVCEITRDGRAHLASGSGDGTIRIWDPDTGQGPRASKEINQLLTSADVRALLDAPGGPLTPDLIRQLTGQIVSNLGPQPPE